MPKLNLFVDDQLKGQPSDTNNSVYLTLHSLENMVSVVVWTTFVSRQVIIGSGLEKYDVGADVWWCAVWCRPFQNSFDSVEVLLVFSSGSWEQFTGQLPVYGTRECLLIQIAVHIWNPLRTTLYCRVFHCLLDMANTSLDCFSVSVFSRTGGVSHEVIDVKSH